MGQVPPVTVLVRNPVMVRHPAMVHRPATGLPAMDHPPMDLLAIQAILLEATRLAEGRK